MPIKQTRTGPGMVMIEGLAQSKLYQSAEPPLYANRAKKHAIISTVLAGERVFCPVYRKGRNWNNYSNGNGGVMSFASQSGAEFFFQNRHIQDYK